jgi:superfamily I DNA/RNA helicase
MLPPVLAQALASITDEDELLEAIEALSPEYQEAVLLGATLTMADPPSDIVAVNDAALEDALRLPTQAWRLFLHPKQRYIVTRPNEGNLVIRGGPGTGKTVALVHRYVHLDSLADRDGGRRPCFVALTPASRRVIREMVASLGRRVPDDALLVSTDIRHKGSLLARTVAPFGSVLVDEGQDLPTEAVANLLSLLERGHELPPIVIAFDSNQAIVHPTGDALRRFSEVSDTLTLTYSYRSTRQITNAAREILQRLHEGFVGKDFIVEHALGASRDAITGRLVAGLEGPEVARQSIDPADAPETVARVVRHLLSRYPPEAIAVIVVARSGETDVGAAYHGSVPEVEVLSPYDAKGREFLAGVVVDMVGMEDRASPTRVTEARYRTLSGLYVAITRFRDRVEFVSVRGGVG